MAKFMIVETIHQEKIKTVRLGTAVLGNQYGDKEIGKAVKLSADNAYTLCAAGDTIEGIISSSNFDSQGTVDGFAIGGISSTGYKSVEFGGVVVVGDYVVVGTVVPVGTILTGQLVVAKAADQAAAKAAPYKARVVSLGKAGTGAIGTVGTVELF